MFIIIWPKLFIKNFRGLTIWPFIFLKDIGLKKNKIIINHEKIHIRQQLEMLWFPFFIWYGIEFLIRWIQYKDPGLAYYNISLEREAYQHEKDFDYLKSRKFFSFLKFL